MSEPSSQDDPFADLYGKLPSSGGASAPSSRRAAREARGSDKNASGSDSTKDSEPPLIDDMFRSSAGSTSTGPRSGKKKNGLGCAIILILIFGLLGGIAVGGFWVWNTYEDQIREVMGWEGPQDYEAGLAEGEVLVTISDGDGGQEISRTLYDAGVTYTPEVFYDLLVDENYAGVFYPGVYSLQYKMTAAAALSALEDPANKRENTAQLREGLTVDQTLTILSEDLSMPLADFEAAVANPSDYGVAADSLEGWLFPATYTFDPAATPTDIIRTMVDRAVQSLDAASVPVEERQRILTVASVIQREARAEEDFYRVSRVIQNRLDIGMKLQMDSTAQYGYGELHDGTVSSTEDALTDDNPWNTYVVEGLPAGPIANPGDVAIDAAMHPSDGDWLYFVTVNLETGETVFTNNYDDHLNAVTQWRAWCTENPDAGC